ncbi:Signal transduction histidine kinase [Streptomyces sp. Ag82_O1-12]|uniref:ATP-binding protein n=1 Tax=unclassified Streptomyces TaxID=2593676 RepID=UPI000BD0B5DE|nr:MULTISPECIES: ATP-binding protein [unclassified Streptomyces]SMQ20599.1 Signal transduction histidine kinase [Streptomyces sp. Ag82_O1-12]SOD49369.1 Signal transduction histidine kinase [Streptomyces sp. Ag82_G6-1]
MSHLRAPATRADRREGGRHGRPAVRTAPALPETHIRPQLLRLAVLPPVAVALSGCAAVLFTVRSTGTRPGLTLWAVLGGAVFVALVGIAVAAVAANRAARSVHDRIGVLRRGTARREADLRTLVEALRRGDGPPQLTPQSRHAGPAEDGDDGDDFDLLSADLSRAHDGAVTAVVQASQLSSQAGSEQKLEVFVNLARRLQSLVHREISILDELENEMEDPELLKGLFHVDHLATRIRRHAENLAVLGGAVSRRQWSNPVSMTEVLRSAIAEVEQYSRVKLVPPIDGQLRGHAVADVIHLLAELVENATVFSAPHTQVLLRANLVTSGLAVEVEDRGLGMPLEEQTRMNALLADPDQVNVARLLADGRIGLFVVSQLARRHGITVRLQTNIYGGVQAVLVVPQALLGAEAGAGTPGGAGQPAAGAPGADGPALPARPDGQAGRSGPAAPGRQAGQNGQVTAGACGASRGLSPVVDGGEVGVSSVPLPASGAGPSIPLTAPTASPSSAAPRRHERQAEPAPGGSSPDGRPAPLPMRGARRERPTPAEARPGISPDDRRILAENVTEPPTPRNGTVRGTMGKPQLPRRRAQEHIVPQLRDGPTPRQDPEYLVGHDPGLMAAFQRGISLAEAQQSMEAGNTEWGDTSSAHMASTHTESAPMASAYTESLHTEVAHMDSSYTDSAHTEVAHTEVAHMDSSYMDSAHTDPAPTGSTRRDPMPVRPVHLEALPSEPSPSNRPTPGSRSDHRTTTTRQDGSAPAG